MAGRRRASSPINPLGSLLFSAGILVLGIVLYATTRLLTEPIPPRWIGNPPPLVEEFPDEPLLVRVAVVTKRLESGALRLPTPIIQAQGGGSVRYEHRQYEITLPPEQTDRLTGLLEMARGGDPAVVTGVVPVDGGQRGEVGIDGLLTHTVLVRWNIPPTPMPARVALVIDDMGNDLLSARQLVSLPYPVALAVVPFRPFSREVAQSAQEQGREVLLHLPLEESPDEVTAAVDASLAAVPHIIGVNNHMSSGFTEDPVRMRIVLERVRARRLFFLDNVTTPKSTAGAVSRALGVPYLAREVVLDATVEEGAIKQRLQALLDAAKRNHQAIGIGNPHRETLAALRDFADTARAQGVEIVKLSALVPTPKAP